jgi:hypothetical protein
VDHQHRRRGRPRHDRGLGDGRTTRQGDLKSPAIARTKSSAWTKLRPDGHHDPSSFRPGRHGHDA